MSRLKRVVLLLLSDTVAVSLASVFFLWMKLASGGLEIVRHNYERLYPDAVDGPSFWYALGYYSDVLPLISGCWLLLFLFFGFYQSSLSSSALRRNIRGRQGRHLGHLAGHGRYL